MLSHGICHLALRVINELLHGVADGLLRLQERCLLFESFDILLDFVNICLPFLLHLCDLLFDDWYEQVLKVYELVIPLFERILARNVEQGSIEH